MKTIIVMCGCPGSGKSTFVEKLSRDNSNVCVVSRDIIRAELGFIKEGEKAVCSKEQENAVTNAWWEKVSSTKADMLIIDDTNTNIKFREDLLWKLRVEFPSVPKFIFRMVTKLETCKERRIGQVPEEVIERMWNGMVSLKAEEGYTLINIKGE